MNRFPTHNKAVPVPLMYRSGIGKLILQLGMVKTKCGGDLSKTRLRLIWIENTQYDRYASGEIQVSSSRQKVTSDAVTEVTNLIQKLVVEHTAQLTALDREYDDV